MHKYGVSIVSNIKLRKKKNRWFDKPAAVLEMRKGWENVRMPKIDRINILKFCGLQMFANAQIRSFDCIKYQTAFKT